MARRLEGKRIALTGPRRSQELAQLVTNMGGIPLLRPSQGTVFLDDEGIREQLASLIKMPLDWAVFTTGMGLEAMFQVAEQMNVDELLLSKLRATRIAARGYKTVNALRKRGLEAIVRDDDGSTEGLIRSWENAACDALEGAQVMLQLHGESAPLLVTWLQGRGYVVTEILPYRHIAPPEEELQLLLDDLVNGQVDAVTFTSAPQVRFLLEHAKRTGRFEQAIAALEGPVVAVSVGRITAQGLKEAGLSRVIAPKEERMGSMMVELAKFYAGQDEYLTLQ